MIQERSVRVSSATEAKESALRVYYDSIMDPETNPLKNLRPQRKFQLMVYLSLMWTTIFCLAVGAWAYFGALVFGHVLVALGVVVTTIVFARATEESGAAIVRTYRDARLSDQTARYDDVWGA